MLSREQIETYFTYDRDSGKFFWKAFPSKGARSLIGTEAGTRRVGGKKEGPQIRMSGVRYRISNMVWFMEKGEWPESYLYHLDGNTMNNQISNLTLRNPQWTRGKHLANSEVKISVLQKDGQWYVKHNDDLIGPLNNMGEAVVMVSQLTQE